jgi:hypothetical protein
MNRAIKLLHKARRKPTSKSSLRRLIRHHRSVIKELSGLSVKVSDEASFFSLLVLYESLTNKQALETCFERTRKELSDLWETLDRQEKNFLANQKLDQTKRKLSSFIDDSGQTIWIACFDGLLNTLYDKRISIFELDQYFKLYTSFTDRLTAVESYGLAPFAQGFIDIDVLDIDADSVLFYYGPLHSLFRVNMILVNTYYLESIPLNPEFEVSADTENWRALHESWRSDQSTITIDRFCDSLLLESKRKKQLMRMKKKLK